MPEHRFDALVLQNGLRPHSSARTSISLTTMRSRNLILKVVSSKTLYTYQLSHSYPQRRHLLISFVKHFNLEQGRALR
jgi:hypothetical protein